MKIRALDNQGATALSGGDAELQVVIVYDDLAAGRHAVQVLSSAEGRAGHRGEMSMRPWKMDILADPDSLAEASSDIDGADILVFSAPSRFDLPQHVKPWLETALLRKRRKPAAVVALIGCAGAFERGGSLGLQYLKDLACRAGCAFFAPVVVIAGTAESVFEDIRLRADTVTPTLSRILDRRSTA